MRNALSECAHWWVLLVVGFCVAPPITVSSHMSEKLGSGSILEDAVNRRSVAAHLTAFATRLNIARDLPVQDEFNASISSILLPINLQRKPNDRGVAGHGYDLGSALECIVPSGWIREGEYPNPSDVPLITHLHPCYVSTHDPNDPAQGPVFGGAAVIKMDLNCSLEVMWVEVRRITSAIL